MIRQTDSIPMIMGGDFNVHSHLDWTDATNMYHHGGALWSGLYQKRCKMQVSKSSFLQEASSEPEKNIGTTWIYDVKITTPIRPY